MVLSVWDITNVLPRSGRLEEGIAAFPEEIPRRLIKLFTFVGETVLAGSVLRFRDNYKSIKGTEAQ
ncbi:MAG: hypothetical protein QW056_04240 [Candidatus Bathyarchaeia archaeon]